MTKTYLTVLCLVGIAFLAAFTTTHIGVNSAYAEGEVPDGYYQIVGVKSGRCLDIRQDGDDRGVLQLIECHDDYDNQKFYVQNIGGVKVLLKLPYNGKCLDVYGGSPANGNRVQEFSCNEKDNQIWDFTSVGDKDGGYRIFSYVGDRICLNPMNGSVGDRSIVAIYSCDMTNNQRWRVKKTSPPSNHPNPPPTTTPAPKPPDLENAYNDCKPLTGPQIGQKVCSLGVKNNTNYDIQGRVCWKGGFPAPGYTKVCLLLDPKDTTFKAGSITSYGSSAIFPNLVDIPSAFYVDKPPYTR